MEILLSTAAQPRERGRVLAAASHTSTQKRRRQRRQRQQMRLRAREIRVLANSRKRLVGCCCVPLQESSVQQVWHCIRVVKQSGGGGMTNFQKIASLDAQRVPCAETELRV